MSSSGSALPAPRRRRAHELFKIAWHRLRGGELTALRLGFSVAVGVFIGCQPLYGLHWVLCVLVCVPLRLDSVVAYLGANISNPVFAPALVTLELEVGALALTGRHLTHGLVDDGGLLVPGLVMQALSGSLLVGLCLALVLGAATFVVSSTVVRGKRVGAPAVVRVMARYRRARLKERLYVGAKLHTDPLVHELCSLKGVPGQVLDVGCGRGQFTFLLQELGLASSALGIDWDERKVPVARLAASAGFDFVVGDVVRTQFPASDTVLLIDLLHYLPRAEQRSLLEKAADAVRPGGRLLVRELDRASRGGALGRASERLAAGTGYNRGVELEFTSLKEISDELSRLGFSCEVRATRRAPFFLPNVLLLATRA